jgi:acyl-coenzyme A synthetase/AMP-(fatty) acid ligase
MIPKAVEVLSALPKTTSGKIDYPELRRRESRALESDQPLAAAPADVKF